MHLLPAIAVLTVTVISFMFLGSTIINGFFLSTFRFLRPSTNATATSATTRYIVAGSSHLSSIVLPLAAFTTTTSMSASMDGTSHKRPKVVDDDDDEASSSINKTTTTKSDDVDDVVQHVPTSRQFIPRYMGPTEQDMTSEQKEIRNAIVQSRPRTGLSGPFGPWLAVPEIAKPASTLGRACRYDTSLSPKESELVILMTGAATHAHAEFDIHVDEAVRAGWTLNVIHAIPRDDAFGIDAVHQQLVPLLQTDRERALAVFCAELLTTHTVSDATYTNTKDVLDGKDSVIVEVTSIVGYYIYVALTLNVFRIPS